MDFAKTYKNYINGKWCDAGEKATYPVYSPGDKDLLIGNFPLSTEGDVADAVEAAHKRFPEWRDLPPSERTKYIYRFGELLSDNKERIAEALMYEEGKTYREALAEPTRGAKEISITAGEALRLEGIARPSDSPRTENTAVRVPIGVVAAITPWNMPILTPLRKAIPALTAGCTVVLKPATVTPLSGVLLAELFDEAGFPPGAFNLITGSGRKMSSALVQNPYIRGVSFTGSTAVGREINRKAAEDFTKVQLEMGGKNAAVVVDYKDLQGIAPKIVKAAYSNTGQRCTAISRVIIREDQADELEKLLVKSTEKLKAGHGKDPASDIGPVISADALQSMEAYIKSAQEEGAKILYGGKRLTGGVYSKGNYLEPTILTNVSRKMKVAQEEIFGPVLVIIRVSSGEEAIDVCNDTEYGLTASIFTDDISYSYDFKESADVGMVRINNLGVSGGNMPFGGWKNSGHGPFGIGSTTMDFYTDVKVVYQEY